MELDWSTFLLEIINFLVLVWILKRFLYQPVLAVIAKRREDIENRLAEVKKAQQTASDLQKQYEGRLGDWEAEREKARAVLRQELDREHVHQLDVLQEALAQAREKARVTNERQAYELQQRLERRAMELAAMFSSRLLRAASGPDLEARLLILLTDDLSKLSDDRLLDLRQHWGEEPVSIDVESGFELSQAQQAHLIDVLHRTSGLDCPLQFTRNADLVAGLRITIGAWVLAANVRDELSGFMEFAHVTR